MSDATPAEDRPVSIRHAVLQDWEANRGRRKSQVVLALFRLAALCARGGVVPSPLARLYVGVYKVLTNWLITSAPPETIMCSMRSM